MKKHNAFVVKSQIRQLLHEYPRYCQQQVRCPTSSGIASIIEVVEAGVPISIVVVARPHRSLHSWITCF